MKTIRGINVSKTVDSMKQEIRLQHLDQIRQRKARAKKEELPFKDALESSGRLSYFTEVFEGISLEEQNIEVEGFPNPTESYFFQKGREIADRLVKNNIATMENYGEFCKVETGKVRNGR